MGSHLNAKNQHYPLKRPAGTVCYGKEPLCVMRLITVCMGKYCALEDQNIWTVFQ
jgi:hypothetical protein